GRRPGREGGGLLPHRPRRLDPGRAARSGQRRLRFLQPLGPARGAGQRSAAAAAARVQRLRPRGPLRLRVRHAMSRRLLIPLALLVVLAPAPAPGQGTRDVRIDVSKGGGRIPILVEALTASGDAQSAGQAQEVLANDLDLSAVFAVNRGWAGPPPDQVQAIVGGRWSADGKEVRLEGEVHDFPARRAILKKDYRGPAAQWRWLVHQFADDIVLQFTGEPGVARTRIAFAAPRGRDKELYVMDLDGAGLQPLTADRSIALSPAWPPDGSLLPFTWYGAGGGPKIYVMPSAGGKSFLISGRGGNNTSPAYSPDGREIACTLSMDGNAEIYRLDARGGSPRRLTTSH